MLHPSPCFPPTHLDLQYSPKNGGMICVVLLLPNPELLTERTPIAFVMFHWKMFIRWGKQFEVTEV